MCDTAAVEDESDEDAVAAEEESASEPESIPSEVDNLPADDTENENLNAAGCVGGTITSKSNNNGFIIMIIFVFGILIGLKRRIIITYKK